MEQVCTDYMEQVQENTGFFIDNCFDLIINTMTEKIMQKIRFK